MYIPSDPKIINGIIEDRFVRRLAFWMPLIIATFLTYLAPQEAGYLNDATKLLSTLPVLIFPSIEVWADRSEFSDKTRIIFSLFAYASLYYGVLFARWDQYKQSFINDPSPLRRHLKPIIIVVLYLLPSLLLFNVALPIQENCMRMCIHESKAIQIIYAFLLSMWLGYGLATVYWSIRYFSRIHFK